MKQLKLFVWILVLMLLRTVLSLFFYGFGVLPDLLFSFAVAYAAYERSVKYVMWVSLICGVIMSSISAEAFWLTVPMFAISAAAVFLSRENVRKIAGYVRAFSSAAVFTAAWRCIIHMISSLSFSPAYALEYILPEVVLNAVCAAVIYALLAKSFKIKDTAKKLIVS